MNQQSFSIKTTPSITQPLRLAFIQARWHAEIVDECRKAFVDACQGQVNGSISVEVFDVPGAFEIPLVARRLARAGRHDAIVGSAFVVNGGIYRHDFVASAVVSGLMQVQLETDVPVLSAVLTPHNFHECSEHRQFFLDHFRTKGREAAESAIAIVQMHRTLAAAA